jgi:hypothetical protein
VELGFVACSGARTIDLADVAWDAQSLPVWFQKQEGEAPGSPQWGEVRQSRSGVLNADTDHVVLTIGGNDGGLFADIVTKCAEVGGGCDQRAPLASARSLVENVTVPRMEHALRDVHSRAPNAAITIATYPHLFKTHDPNATDPDLCYLVVPDEVDAITGVQRHYHQLVSELVEKLYFDEGWNITFAPVEDWFTDHDACADDEDQWLNGLILRAVDRQGDGDYRRKGEPEGPKDPSNAAMHPNDIGTSAYARGIECALERGAPNLNGAFCPEPERLSEPVRKAVPWRTTAR